MDQSTKPDYELLHRVALDNMRTNQLGGVHDGVDWETAADMGFTTPDKMAELRAAELQAEADRVEHLQRVAPPAGRVTVASQNATEARQIAEHRARTRHARQIFEPFQRR